MDDDGSETLDKREFLDVMRGLVKFAGKSSPSVVARSRFQALHSDGMCVSAFQFPYFEFPHCHDLVQSTLMRPINQSSVAPP
jgi:hypothetical protein